MNKSNKSKITNSEKFKTMIFSIVIAIAVWLVAVYVNDPSITVTANNVSVRLLNEDVLKENGLVIKNKEKFPTFSVRVSGKRSNLMNYMNRVTIDFELAKIEQAGTYELEGVVSLPNSYLTLAKKGNTKMSLEVAPISEKTIRVYAIQTGTNKEFIIKSVPVESEIAISGAADEVSQIAYAALSVDVSNAVRDFESTGEIYFCDIEGKKLDNVTSVKSDKNVVKVENILYQKVTIPVKAELSEELEQEYILDAAATTISPAQVVVGVLGGTEIKDVTVKIGKISSATEKYRISTDTEGVYIPYTNSEVAIDSVIHKRVQKDMELNLKAINVPSGMKAEYEAKVTLNVECAENVTAQQLSAVVDMSGAALGDNSVKVKVEGNNVASYESKYVNIKLVQG